MFNIFRNAVQTVKAGREGKGSIAVSTYMNGNYICCDIKDNGNRMSEEKLKKSMIHTIQSNLPMKDKDLDSF
ncbi:MAG TPA: hypothetical protein GXX14_02385 [Clostridiaceae bacterium]|nr:hypothetical protein [Clostridiaceae bacterium]